MTTEQFELLNILKNKKLPFEKRYWAVKMIGLEAGLKKNDQSEIKLFYEPMVELWRSLGLSKKDRKDEKLFSIRKKIASFCLILSLQLPEGQKFFTYYPKVKKAEGFDPHMNKRKKGVLKTGYGSSLYEFHLEYPIEGIGIRKDLITVISDESRRIPMLEWCKQNDIIVYCNRCGLEITYEVSRDCPFRNQS